MRQKNILKGLGKAIAAAALAFAGLTLFCGVYSNVPVHYPDEDGATDYRWEPNAIYSQMTEGFSHGRTNNEGYHSQFDYERGEKIDILVMGSSHFEGGNVAVEQTAASRLGALLSHDTVYNIGTSGHTFLVCVSNLEKAVEKYRPARYVVIETGEVLFSDGEMARAIEGTVADIPSHAEGIVGLLQRNPFLRQLYHQMQNGKKWGEENAEAASEEEMTGMRAGDADERLLGELLDKIGAETASTGSQAIVLYHPAVAVNSDGSLGISGDASAVRQFETLCEESGILFIDMGARFAREYAENRILPYGFSNTSVGSGHLNKYGHAMIADELYALISEVG